MKIIFRLICLLLLGGVVGCAPEQLSSVDIFFTTDIEGTFWARPEPRHGNEIVGGLSVLKSFLDKQTDPFLLLEGGNWFAQTPEGTLSKGDSFNQLISNFPYTARLFAAPDLVYGWGSLSHILKNSPTPFVLSNVSLYGGYIPAGAKQWLLTKIGDYKVGIIGLVSPSVSHGEQRRGSLQIADPLQTARELVPQLRAKGAQVIVVLSSLGVSESEHAVTDVELAEEVSGIDIIIQSGLDREKSTVQHIGKTRLVYVSSRLASIGKLQLFFTKQAVLADVQFEEVVLYKRDFAEDETIAAEIEKLRQTVQGQMIRQVGKSDQELTGQSDGESALGDWVADCLRKWAKADAAVIHSSALRSTLPMGSVSQYDLYNLYPYNDHVTYLTIKGSALQRALEESLSTVDNFPQVAGLQIKYRPTGLAGHRISSIKINGAPLSSKNTYRVAVVDSILSGAAGHDGFINSLEFKNTQVEMRTVLRLCLSGKKAVTPPETNRWSAVK